MLEFARHILGGIGQGGSMTNDGMTNAEKSNRLGFRHLIFVLLSSFDIGHSPFPPHACH